MPDRNCCLLQDSYMRVSKMWTCWYKPGGEQEDVKGISGGGVKDKADSTALLSWLYNYYTRQNML